VRESPRADASTFLVGALALAFLVVLGLLDWLMLGPPRKFGGFLADGSSPDELNRLNLYAEPLGRGPVDMNSSQYAWAVRAALITLLLLHVVAIWLVRRRPRPRALWFGLPVLAQIVALGYPPLGADVFYYAMSGHMVADLGVSPYVFPPAAVQGDPLLPYNFWIGITSPYGPLWTTICSAVVGVVGTDPVRVVLAFNTIAALAALGYAVVTYRLAEHIRPGSGLVAFVVTAWHPLLIVQSGAQGHNDALLAGLALFGLLLMGSSGRMRPALLLIGASVLIKYATLPLLVLAALDRLRERSWSRIARLWLGDGAALAVLALLVAAPYWANGAMIDSLVSQPARRFSNPLLVPLSDFLAERWGAQASLDFRELSEPVLQLVVLLGTITAMIWVGVRVWRDRPEGAAVLAVQLPAWATVTMMLSLLLTNTRAWYWIWALGPVAAVSGGRGRLLAGFLAVLGLGFVIYQTQLAPN
jgi:alpha-1,6-mannosyltransferase